MRLFKTAVFTAVTLVSPLLVTGSDTDTSFQVVHLVAPDAGQANACPEAQLGKNSQIYCSITGVVQSVRLEPSKITVFISGQDFHYLAGENSRWEMGGPIYLFAASRVNQAPITLQFQNWGGLFYITEARF